MIRLRFETGDGGKLLAWGAQGLDRLVGGMVATEGDCHGLDVAAACGIEALDDDAVVPEFA
jgi:hypothetical protein